MRYSREICNRNHIVRRPIYIRISLKQYFRATKRHFFGNFLLISKNHTSKIISYEKMSRANSKDLLPYQPAVVIIGFFATLSE